MNLRTLSTAVVVACALALPSTTALAAPGPTITPFGVTSSATNPGVSVLAAKKKPKAVVTATFTTLPINNKVSVQVTSNAKQVQVKYRTAKNKKRALNRKLKGGTATIVLPVGSQKILVRAKATNRLATSPWTTATQPAPPVPPVVPVAEPVSPPAPPVTPPVTPPTDATPPAPVTGLAVIATTTSTITLSWTNPTDADLDAIIVRRDGSDLYTGTGSSFSDTGLIPDTTYTYTVLARDTIGNTSALESVTSATRVSSSAGSISLVSSVPLTQLFFSAADPGWSPDSKKVTFAAFWENDNDGWGDGYIHTLATGEDVDVWNSTGQTWGPKFSPDGTHVAFQTMGVVDEENPIGPGIMLMDLTTGSVVSVASTGGYYTRSLNPVFSPDGSQLAFASEANLVPEDTNQVTDVYVANLSGGGLQRVSVGQGGTQGDGDSTDPAFSPDGQEVLFTSAATNLVPDDTNGSMDVFVKSLDSTAVDRLSVAESGAQGNGASADAVFSPDGGTVVFASTASNLVAGDTNGACDVFLKVLDTGVVVLLSQSVSGFQGNSDSQEPDFSPDGRLVAFSSGATNLLEGDTNSSADVYMKSLDTGGVELVSAASDGTPGNRGSNTPVFSPDGTMVAFVSSATNFAPGGLALADIYVKVIR